MDFDLPAGTVTGLVGPNGAGKTTLIKLLAGLLRPAGGTVTLNGQDMTGLAAPARGRAIGYVEQSGRVAWPLSVESVVALGRLPFGQSGQTNHPSVDAAMASCGLNPFRGRSATTLSGGERTRTLIARALAGEPAVLLADEPTSGLDARHQLQIMDVLKTLAADGVGILIATHDLSLVARYCDRLAVMVDGRITHNAAPADLVANGALERAYGVKLMMANDPAPALVPWRLL